MPSVYTSARKGGADMVGLSKYTRRQRRPPSNLHSGKEIFETPRHKGKGVNQPLKLGNGIINAEKFVGSGGF